VTNNQTSWVKMGVRGAQLCLNAGANDLGGTLMNESISRAAGTQHGQELPPAAMRSAITSIGRVPEQRDTFYLPVPEERRAAAEAAPDLSPVILTRPTDDHALSRLTA
jgi:FO synthase